MSENENIKILCVRIDKDLYNQLRKVAFKKTGRLHGAITIAVKEAIQDYINKYSKESEEKHLAQIPQA
jgi:predicted DNA-binding protein